MFKRLVLKSITAVALLHSLSSAAKEVTPVEAYIYRMKETTPFVTVGDIWRPDNNYDKTEMLKNVEDGQPLVIDYSRLAEFISEKHTGIKLVLPAQDGGTYTIELGRYSFLTNDFEVHDIGAGGSDTKFNYEQGLYYRGDVEGYPGSVAAFSFFKNEVYGIFSIPNVGNIVVEPNTLEGKEWDYNTHYVMYNDMDIKFKDKAPICAADGLSEKYYNRGVAGKTTTTLNNKIYSSCRVVRSFEVADYIMFTKKGSVTNCTNYLTSLYNNKSTLYMNEGVAVALKYVEVHSANDGYGSLPNDSHRWLTKFGYNTQNTLHGCDLATLYTTKNAGMGGVAWLGTTCQPYWALDTVGPYSFCNINNSSATTASPSFPTYSWDVEVSTHEMGHNVGSPHTHRCCWNPPARVTAIDGCYTLEGSCAIPSPAHPSGGGTIMSYCHLTSVGINFTKGFGPQPGDTVRYFVAHLGSSCGENYLPSLPLAVANKTATANKECTDVGSATTYYWNDAGTADHTDDTLVLAIKKNGNNIGDMNNTSFSVKSTTLTGYGSGSALPTTFPSGTYGAVAGTGKNFAMRRYWSITPVGSSTVTTAVDVIYGFKTADTSDVNGSVPGTTAPLSNYRMYVVKNPVDPNPANNFPSATASSISVLKFGSSPSTSQWVVSSASAGSIFAYFKTTNLAGGGVFYPNGYATSVGELNTAGLEIFPNPTSGDWNIRINDDFNQELQFSLYSADGRMHLTQSIRGGVVNTVKAATLPAGVYFYRLVSGGDVLTGSLVKQ